MYTLRDHILKFGGQEVCMPSMDPDLSSLLKRGQFWYGDKIKMELGEACQCHANSYELWLEEKDHKDIHIATGYALTEDGMWRQHSWLIYVKPRSRVIIETTVKRIAYFGFVLSKEEAEEFGENYY